MLARDWDETVEQVRDIDGFEDFGLPPRLASQLPTAAGPVLIFTASRWRFDALIVRSERGEVVEQPDLDQEQAAVRKIRAHGGTCPACGPRSHTGP